MSNFEAALKHVLSVEGGFSNHPADRGGATKFGITVGTLAAYRGIPTSAKDVSDLTETEARQIYKTRYWDEPGLERLTSPLVSLLVFDQCVNAGPKVAVRMLQLVLKKWDRSLAVDGDLGPVTADLANRLSETNVAIKFIAEIQKRYLEICHVNPSQRIFLSGWMARTWSLLDRTLV